MNKNKRKGGGAHEIDLPLETKMEVIISSRNGAEQQIISKAVEPLAHGICGSKFIFWHNFQAHYTG